MNLNHNTICVRTAPMISSRLPQTCPPWHDLCRVWLVCCERCLQQRRKRRWHRRQHHPALYAGGHQSHQIHESQAFCRMLHLDSEHQTGQTPNTDTDARSQRKGTNYIACIYLGGGHGHLGPHGDVLRTGENEEGRDLTSLLGQTHSNETEETHHTIRHLTIARAN